MPRSREMGQHQQQRQSPRGPLHLKTPTSSESNGGVVNRPIRDRSPKVEEHRRSPRSPLPECKQKKRGTRVTDLETRLGHAQEELRKLKEQLASSEASVAGVDETKKEETVEKDESEKANAETRTVATAEIDGEKKPAALVAEGEVVTGNPMEKAVVVVETPVEKGRREEGEGAENSDGNLLPKKKRMEEGLDAKQEELVLKLAEKEEELERSREEVASLREQVGSLTKAKEEMEIEKRKLKVQLEQWRKAADAATAIISGEDDYGSGVGLVESRGMAERRYGHLVGPEEVVGFGGGDGTRANSPDVEDGGGGPRRRSSAGGGGGGGGIRMFGELWRRKGMLQHK